MFAVGIDLGGTKIEVQNFASDWSVIDRSRIPTPSDYADLVDALARIIRNCGDTPVGLCSAGLTTPATGLFKTANLPAEGKPFPADVQSAAGRPVQWLNDARALALSEAVFGAGQGASRVAGVIVGTGVSGAVIDRGALLSGPSGTAGEFGHAAAPAHLIAAHGLPIHPCGCGRTACIETYISARSLERLDGQGRTAPDICAERGRSWQLWCDLTAEMLLSLTLTVDPDVIVLAGGLSNAPHILPDLAAALQAAQFSGFSVPRLAIAQGGDASGARGAAWLAAGGTL